MTVGWLTMIPYVSGGIGLVGWGLLSDRMNERRWNLRAACAVSAIGLIIAGLTIGSWWAMVGLSIATFGFYGSKDRSGLCHPCSSRARQRRLLSLGSIPSAISAASSAPRMSV